MADLGVVLHTGQCLSKTNVVCDLVQSVGETTERARLVG
jgi:hypothetical protein